MKIRTISVTAMLALLAATSIAVAAAPNVITIDDQKVFPESVTATAAGDVIVGSWSKGAVYRAKAGTGHATLWLDPAKTGFISVLGVFADNASNTLYVCSNSPATPKDSKYDVLYTFDLTTGAPKKSYPMITPEKATCNDIDVAKDGTAYITDTGNAQVLRLKKGAAALEVWAKDERLVGVDGLALGNRVLYVNSVTKSRLFAIAMESDGAAGAITELQSSMPLAHPDGMRALGGNKFLMAENSTESGRITEVTVTGDKADIKVLKVDPGVTAMTKSGNMIWVDNAKFTYRADGALKDQNPEPFVLYALPYK